MRKSEREGERVVLCGFYLCQTSPYPCSIFCVIGSKPPSLTAIWTSPLCVCVCVCVCVCALVCVMALLSLMKALRGSLHHSARRMGLQKAFPLHNGNMSCNNFVIKECVQKDMHIFWEMYLMILLWLRWSISCLCVIFYSFWGWIWRLLANCSLQHCLLAALSIHCEPVIQQLANLVVLSTKPLRRKTSEWATVTDVIHHANQIAQTHSQWAKLTQLAQSTHLQQ